MKDITLWVASWRPLRLIGLLCLCLTAVSVAAAQDTPPCENRFRNPYVIPKICPEYVLEDFAKASNAPYGIDAIRNLAFDREGVLYFTSPAHRAIFRMPPDGEIRFGAPERFVELPQAPNGLIYTPELDSFFATGDSMIWRITSDGAVITLVGDLPSGAGFWLGQPLLGSDGWLYVGKGAARHDVPDSDARRGTLLRIRQDGSEVQIVAHGLRDPAALALIGETLYILDNERADYPAELNQVHLNQFEQGKLADFGFPHCNPLGKAVLPNAMCADTTSPILTFAPESTPSAILYYAQDHFARLNPNFKGSLLVALSGSWNAATISGYEIVQITLAQGIPTARKFIPDYFQQSTADAALLRASFYPYRVTGLAISREGWLYAAIGEGYIYRFRLRAGIGQ